MTEPTTITLNQPAEALGIRAGDLLRVNNEWVVVAKVTSDTTMHVRAPGLKGWGRYWTARAWAAIRKAMPEPKRDRYKRFTFKGRDYRLYARTVWQYEYGYAEPAQEMWNILEVRCFRFFWHEIEREHVPSHAWIGAATVGDTGGWVSALHDRCYLMGMQR
ncbi:hypothetical protein UFOVP1040_30 [uncultured Caudovirales phage]|uniref:Uncharacterized protein n=1 Tax=uncultured Caudovirales phage TaxID=2100421 RepID=A0A6J5Q635_9CAUD|nr:hypothetical protein UFOVP1040_30 [uncultured Caudovirales phage]